MRTKEIIKSLFPGLVDLKNRVYNYLAHYRFKDKPTEEVFTLIYQENHWKGKESKSGTGSANANTQHVIEAVNRIVRDYNIKSFLDIPCGDFNWMRKVSLDHVNYIGADIVTELMTSNDQNYASSNRKFIKLNILLGGLPKCDIIFCRDCLVHFSFKDIHKAIESIRDSGSSYLMTTTFPSHKNYDIITGDWRPINLQAKPFNFPAPLFLEKEFTLEDDRYWDKSLAVWKINEIDND